MLKSLLSLTLLAVALSAHAQPDEEMVPAKTKSTLSLPAGESVSTEPVFSSPTVALPQAGATPESLGVPAIPGVAAGEPVGTAPGTPVVVYRSMTEAKLAGIEPLKLGTPTAGGTDVAPVADEPERSFLAQAQASLTALAESLGVPLGVVLAGLAMGLLLPLGLLFRAAFPSAPKLDADE